MVTSFIEMLELPNFGHMNTSTIKFESRDKIFLLMSSAGVLTSKRLFQNTFILRRTGVAIFTDIIKIIISFIKKIFKD